MNVLAIELNDAGIRAARSGDDLLISVLDHGTGAAVGEVGQGSGIANSEARLEQIHGGGRRLVLSGGEDGGTLVTLRIPWRLESADVAAVVG